MTRTTEEQDVPFSKGWKHFLNHSAMRLGLIDWDSSLFYLIGRALFSGSLASDTMHLRLDVDALGVSSPLPIRFDG